MRVCSADYILHYLHVTATKLYSLSSLTSVGWTACAGTINFVTARTCGGIVCMSLQTQSLRLAGERALRWINVGDMYYILTGMCSNYQVVIVTILAAYN